MNLKLTVFVVAAFAIRFSRATCAQTDFVSVLGSHALSFQDPPVIAFRANSEARSGYSHILMAQRSTIGTSAV